MNDPYMEEIIQSVEEAEKAVEDTRTELNQHHPKTPQRKGWIRRIIMRNRKPRKRSQER